VSVTAPVGEVRWPREAIIEAIQDFVAEHGRPPYAKEWRRASNERPTYETVWRCFGTWNEALMAAEIDGWVPTALLAAAIDEWARGTAQANERLSERCGIDSRMIFAIRRRTYAKTSFANADAICTAIGLHVDLLYLYEGAAA
jgi:hypothetical protein